MMSGQAASGTLKIFSDEPLIIYVDQVHYPDYREVTLVPGTHYVKALNKDEIKVYNEIVTIKASQVTSILIEAMPPPQPAVQSGLTYGQPVTDTPASQGAESPGPKAVPKPSIAIGQVGGVLPGDMSGAFGLTFGMSTGDVDRIMSSMADRAQRNQGYYVYAIRYGSSVYVVECRFIDQKLFQIIVGYPSVYTNNAKLKLDKKEVPFPEFNLILNDVTAIYGEPAAAEKVFLDGYSEDDGRILEALRRKKALILYTWFDRGSGNNVMVGLAYTNTPLAGAIYTSGPLSAQAAARNLRLNGYDYNKSFKENYFSK